MSTEALPRTPGDESRDMLELMFDADASTARSAARQDIHDAYYEALKQNVAARQHRARVESRPLAHTWVARAVLNRTVAREFKAIMETDATIALLRPIVHPETRDTTA